MSKKKTVKTVCSWCKTAVVYVTMKGSSTVCDACREATLKAAGIKPTKWK